MTDARLDRLLTQGPLRHDPRLDPGGTARRRFAGDHGAQPELDDLYARARALDLSFAVVDAARAIADLSEGLSPLRRAALLHLLIIVLIDSRAGSTRTPVVGPDGQAHLRARLQSLLGPFSAEAALTEINALVAEGAPSLLEPVGGRPSPLIIDGDAVCTQRLHQLEHRVVQAFAARLTRPPRHSAAAAAAATEDVVARPILRGGQPSPLSDEQARAVATAAQLRLSVISGGPGTGKTSIAVGLVRTLVRLGTEPFEIAVAAPTGKAAHRVSESIRQGLENIDRPAPDDTRLAAELPAAETLHRLLGYSPRFGRFARSPEDPLVAKVVIIDEASMVDLRLMDALVNGLAEDAQLVLLGDADQLPSVDAGAVLRDLCAGDLGGQYSVRLTHSYRMDASDPRGAEILSAARAIHRGEHPLGPVRARPRQLSHEGFEQLRAEDAAARGRFIDAWVARYLSGRSYRRAANKALLHRDGAFRAEDLQAIEALSERLNRFRVLTVSKSLAMPTGADALNQALHERLVAAEGADDQGPLPGEPVMMLRNDYERGLFNGDVGVIMRVAVDNQAAIPMVIFLTARGYAPFPYAVLQQDLTLAHAMTVHKAQGSEFDAVAVFLPEVDVPILTKEVLYTGLTRARKSVVIVGPPALTSRAVARPALRHSGLAAGLARALREVAESEPGLGEP